MQTRRNRKGNQMENQQKEKPKTKTKLITGKADIIIIAVFVVAALVILLSPKMYYVKTARWQTWNQKNTDMVVTAMGADKTEERFRLYFQYYNVIHELGHGLICYNHGVNIPIAEEEQLVNDFAVAYWKYYGDPEKTEELRDIACYAVEHIGDNYQNGVDYMELGKANSDHSDFHASFFNFNDYGWFQFSCVKHSFEQDKSLEDVLKEMGFKDAKLTEPTLLKHEIISEEESTRIINEAIDNFHAWGLKFPETRQSFSSDPNENYSKPRKNILHLMDLF